MKSRSEVVILGGGVIGLTTAYFLAREGVSVAVCEQGATGMEASWAGAGILPPSDSRHARNPFDRLRALSGQLFPDLSRELQDRTGINNGFVRCGGLEFASDGPAAVQHEWYGEGIANDVVSEEAARELEPRLAPHLGQAIHVRCMAQLRNPRHMQALRAACLATKNVTIHENTPAQEFLPEEERIKAVRTQRGILEGDTFVVAAGAWTDALLEPLGLSLHVQPVRGQIALLNPGETVVRHILISGAQYIVPRLDGRLLIGSTEEHVGFDKSTTAQGIEGLLGLAMRLVPCLAHANLEKAWSGLRPVSPDGLPFIGVVPGVANLFVATGHFRAGIQLSPGTALLLKERILGQPLSLSMDAFRLDR